MPPLRRRRMLGAALAWPMASPLAGWAQAPSLFERVRPGDALWPSDSAWRALGGRLQGELLVPSAPWSACARPGAACDTLWRSLRNPYAIGDDPALTQTLGWVDAWTSQPSARVVAAHSAADVAAAVDFARTHRLRLVVRGGGHSYQGTSNAADSLLVWLKPMQRIELHEDFAAEGCPPRAWPQPAVTIEAGATWAQAYDAVTTRGGRYVQGGGCMTVGVAGLVQSGGFGSFSKAFGLAAGNLIQAEVVTADGQVRRVNASRDPELFWALKGGGGGSLGVVTRLTLRTHALPSHFGVVSLGVQARSPEAMQRLIDLALRHYAEHLHNPHWGEQIRLRPDRSLRVEMVFQGLNRGEAQAAWAPFLEAVAAAPEDFMLASSPLIIATSPRDFWAPSFVKKTAGFMRSDGREGAPEGHVFWAGDEGQVGQVLHGYGSAWLPADLLDDARRPALVAALFEASRHAGVSLHVNKGLAGARPAARSAALDCAMNPQVADAFALAICAAAGPPAYPGVAGHEPDAVRARSQRARVDAAMNALRRAAPGAGAYLAESDFFERDWSGASWGAHYPRLRAAKARYDPEGLFFVHHGVGSEGWSEDGFRRLS